MNKECLEHSWLEVEVIMKNKYLTLLIFLHLSLTWQVPCWSTGVTKQIEYWMSDKNRLDDTYYYKLAVSIDFYTINTFCLEMKGWWLNNKMFCFINWSELVLKYTLMPNISMVLNNMGLKIKYIKFQFYFNYCNVFSSINFKHV